MLACSRAAAQSGVDTLDAHLRAKATWSTQINLTWGYSRSFLDERIELLIERSGDSSNYVQIAAVEPFNFSYKDLVEPSTRYYYRLRVDHPTGESAYSNEASARTPGREFRLVLRSIAAEDGFVCEEASFLNRGGRAIAHWNGAAIIIGDLDHNEQCKGIVSFDTSVLPDDAEIVTWVVRIYRHETKGRPFSDLGGLYYSMNSDDGFGGSLALRPRDFEAPADSRYYISKTGRSQFRLFFARPDDGDASADYEGFHSGESERYPPLLEIIYRKGRRARNQ